MTEIPANVSGSGRVVAVCGFVWFVFNPETKIVVIWPGDTRI